MHEAHDLLLNPNAYVVDLPPDFNINCNVENLVPIEVLFIPRL